MGRPTDSCQCLPTIVRPEARRWERSPSCCPVVCPRLFCRCCSPCWRWGAARLAILPAMSPASSTVLSADANLPIVPTPPSKDSRVKVGTVIPQAGSPSVLPHSNAAPPIPHPPVHSPPSTHFPTSVRSPRDHPTLSVFRQSMLGSPGPASPPSPENIHRATCSQGVTSAMRQSTPLMGLTSVRLTDPRRHG